jgi:hypothetical protein
MGAMQYVYTNGIVESPLQDVHDPSDSDALFDILVKNSCQFAGWSKLQLWPDHRVGGRVWASVLGSVWLQGSHSGGSQLESR